MDFILKMNCDNAAFDDDCNEEVARILEEAAKSVREGYTFKASRDTNGNIVGRFDFTGGE